jgi:predicted ATP-grasp superfamily ATP-dependent carboligase
MNAATAAALAAPRLVIAGQSVRAAAQAAQRDGLAVTALDLFGDADTRAASVAWRPLAQRPGAPWQIDPASLRAALAALSAEGAPITGLAVTGGFEADAAALDDLPVPWLGTPPAAIARVRDPALFFAALDAYGIAHPAVSLTPVAQPGWLRKDFGASGGAHVQPAEIGSTAGPSGPQIYWQQRLDGEPLSLTLLADGRQAALLGLNRQLLAPASGLPYRFGGLIGPLPWSGHLQTRLQGIADRLVPHFGLRGLCSIDLLQSADPLLDEADTLRVLEVNPRLPASLALYGCAGGLMRAHVEACLHVGHLPQGQALSALRGQVPDDAVGGFEIVYLPAAWQLDEFAWHRLHTLAATLGLQDLPAYPLRLEAGQPLCTVSARGADASTVAKALAQRHARLLQVMQLSTDLIQETER